MRFLGTLIGMLGLMWLTPTCVGPELHCEFFSISEDFTPEERNLILNAGAQWNALADRTVVSFHEWGDPHVCGVNRLNSEADYNHAKATKVLPPSFAGFYVSEYGQIWVYPRDREPEVVEGIVTHEMGHYLGLEHVRDGVMAKNLTRLRFSYEDHAECLRQGVCSSGWPNGYPRPTQDP